MGYRVDTFAPGNIYHLCHRGISQQNIFRDDQDRQRFLRLLTYYLPRERVMSYSLFREGRGHSTKHKQPDMPLGRGLVDLLCYCLMDNHIHLLLKENCERGISRYAQRIFNSYARYFNTRYDRSGGLFSGRFRSALVDGDEQFLHVTRYIHLNPFAAGLADDPTMYIWSSVREYLPGRVHGQCHTMLLASMMRPAEYQQFVVDYADYARELAVIKHVALDM